MPGAGLAELTSMIVAFRDERDWKQFHNAKDVAVSLALEASEYLELHQWKQPTEWPAKERAAEELADVLYWVLLAAHDQKIDLAQALHAKLGQNAAKYPVSKARGKAAKYSEL